MKISNLILLATTLAFISISRGQRPAGGGLSSATALASTKPNVLLILVDDLRPLFGKSFGVPEVLAPNIDSFFLNGGTAFQNSYVQIAVCGPSRASMLTSRRPDTTTVGTDRRAGGGDEGGWCWCRRTNCSASELFMTLPTYFRQNGYVTAGAGKVFHPDACNGMMPRHHAGFSHKEGDDPRAWSNGYAVEANFSQEQWGSIPGPYDPVFDYKMGLSFNESDLSDEEQTDGMLANDAIKKLGEFRGSEKPFFLAVGFHKPHLPHIVPKKYFDLYDPSNITLPPNPRVPRNFLEENWHADGNKEMMSYNLNAGPEFKKEGFGFNHPISDAFARKMRHGYFAATSFIDAQVGRVLSAFEKNGFANNTIVVLWSDHGWHLGDTNSWCKMTNFETGTRNTLLFKVPGQAPSSTGRSHRLVEALDLFPTLVDLASLPPLAKCQGRDQPPTVQCLQGESFAGEFRGGDDSKGDGDDSKGDADASKGSLHAGAGKQYAFSQWPYRAWPAAKAGPYRMGYTVRSATGFRFTEYVPYDDAPGRNIGNWTEDPARPHDTELYDYKADPHETSNVAASPAHAQLVQKLKQVLRQQFA